MKQVIIAGVLGLLALAPPAVSAQENTSKQFSITEANQAYAAVMSCTNTKGVSGEYDCPYSSTKSVKDALDVEGGRCLLACVNSGPEYNSCNTCVKYYSYPDLGFTRKSYSSCDGVCHEKNPGSGCVSTCNDSYNAKLKEVTTAVEAAIDDWKELNAKSGSTKTTPAPATTPPSISAPKVVEGTTTKVAPTIDVKPKPKPGPINAQFNAAEKKAKPVKNPKIVDASNKTIAASALQKGLTKKVPAVTLTYQLKNIKAGQTVSIQPPKGLPAGKILLTSKQAIPSGSVSVTIIDAAQSISKYPNIGALGSPDYPPPLTSTDYTPKNYFVFTAKVKKEPAHPWKEIFFKWATPTAVANYARALHWSGDDRRWNELPSELIACGHTCLTTAKSNPFDYSDYTVIATKKQ